MPGIVCRRVRFWSQRDEESFEARCAGISCVTRREWVGDAYRLTLRRRRIPQRDLGDLVALFMRYQIARMDQVAQFLDGANRRWFSDPRKLYHRRVFRRLALSLAPPAPCWPPRRG